MRRRNFIGSLAAGSLSAAPIPGIDATVMQHHLTALSEFGRPPGGTFQSGVTRIGYSDADIAARKFVTKLMENAGAKVRVDAAGNIFAERPGLEPSLPAVLFGSHIDSVPNGGNFDGDLGSIASIQVLRVLQENRLQTRHPLTAVIWACEEASFAGASLNGSRAAAGQMLPGELNHISGGLVKSEAVRRIGGDPSRIEKARLQSGAYHAYVELHIEQGGTLARDEVPIGVVDGIVAIDRYEAIVTGFANHAGTTPMADRQDALMAAAELALAVRETLARGSAVLWSTSRDELWHKGATSGDVLALVEVRVNCEQNSLLYRVRRTTGGACHTKDQDTGEARGGCYYRVLTDSSTLRFAE